MTDRGHSLVELLFVVATLATLAGIAVPPLLTGLDEHRTAAAARYVATRVHRARMEAISRSTSVALQFVAAGSGYSFSAYADGNGDGVRTTDIRDGVDSRLSVVERLSDNFAGVDFAVLPNLPPIEPGSAPPGSDPIKLGAGNLLSYSASGSSSSGSVYIKGRGKAQYAVRILGDTGRSRILRYDVRSGQWQPL